MMVRRGKGTLGSVLGVALLACGCSASTSGGSNSSSAQTPTGPTSSQEAGSGVSTSTGPVSSGSSNPGAAATKTSGAANVGVVINEGWQVLPAAMKVADKTHLIVTSTVDDQGEFAAINPGTEISAEPLKSVVNVAWFDNGRIIKVDAWKACGQACPKLKAPAGARFVLAQRQTSDDRISVASASSLRVTLTKVNTELNNRPDRASSTEPPK